MKIPKIIRTERLVLRPYAEDDFEAFFEFVCDAEATRYLRFTPEQKTHEGAKAFFNDVIDSYAGSKPLFVLAITCARAGQYMGSCGLVPLKDGTGVECYYVLLQQFWGRGFASEAVRALFGHAFTELRINRIVALIRKENHHSQRVVERLGMRNNGIIFDHMVSENVILFSIDKKDAKDRFRA